MLATCQRGRDLGDLDRATDAQAGPRRLEHSELPLIRDEHDGDRFDRHTAYAKQTVGQTVGPLSLGPAIGDLSRARRPGFPTKMISSVIDTADSSPMFSGCTS